MTATQDQTPPGAHMIVVGNEKGGSGKSTTVMHVVAGLLQSGHRVGSLDLDARQATLSRYLANRQQTIERSGLPLPMPAHESLLPSSNGILADARAEDEAAVAAAIRFAEKMRQKARAGW